MWTEYKNKKWTPFVLLCLPVAWVIVVCTPELFRDRIFPTDSALIAANGALFHSMFLEFGSFVSAPIDWLWAYFEQYPALSVRRHPPLFGFIEGVVYLIGGVSVFSAKLTVMLFACAFAAGVMILARRFFGELVIAMAATFLIVASPEFVTHFSSVWLDIPSLAFAVWVFYFYLSRLDGDKSTKNILGMVLFTVLTLYTYQPTIFLLSGIFVHLVYREWRSIFFDRQMWLGALVLVVLMLPLIVFTVYFALDSLLAATGEVPAEWKEYDSPEYGSAMVREKLSLVYWLKYAHLLWEMYPVQAIGLGLWLGLCFVRRPSTFELFMFTSFVVTYLLFSWLVVKGPRYTLYLMIPVSFIAVSALHDVVRYLWARKSRGDVLVTVVCMLAAAGQYAFVPLYGPYVRVAELDRPVRTILDANPRARVLYSGRSDAAFVFYMRSLDLARGVSVRRASMQVTDPDMIEEYVSSEQIDYVLLEVKNDAQESLEIIDEFRESILSYAERDSALQLLNEFELPVGSERSTGSLVLNVYSVSKSDDSD